MTNATTDCLLWSGARYGNGYGQRRFQGKRMGAHRAAWIERNGEIPEGLEIDHLCNVRRCVNVEHLQLVTHRENTRLRVARWSTCKSGRHPRVGPGLCRPCRREYEQSAEFKSSQNAWEKKNLEKRRAYQAEWHRKRRAEG